MKTTYRIPTTKCKNGQIIASIDAWVHFGSEIIFNNPLGLRGSEKIEEKWPDSVVFKVLLLLHSMSYMSSLLYWLSLLCPHVITRSYQWYRRETQDSFSISCKCPKCLEIQCWLAIQCCNQVSIQYQYKIQSANQSLCVFSILFKLWRLCSADDMHHRWWLWNKCSSVPVHWIKVYIRDRNRSTSNNR